MSRCKNIIDDLKAYADGALPLVRRGMVRLHVSRCPACREEVTAMSQISTNLLAGDTGGLTAALRERLISAAPEADSVPSAVQPRRWRPRPLEIWGAAAAAVVMFFVLMPVFAPARERAQRVSVLSQTVAANAAYSSDYDESIATSPTPAFMDGHVKGMTRMGGERDAAGDQAPGFTSTPVSPVVQRPETVTRTSRAPRIGGDGLGGRGLGSGRTYGDGDRRVQPLPPPNVVFMSSPVRVARAETNGKGKLQDVTNGVPPASPDTQGYARNISKLNSPVQGRSVKKTAEITIVVRNLEPSSDNVENMVRESGGYVANNQLTTDEYGTKQATLEVRVPVTLFDQMIGKFARLGDLKSKHVTGEDLTEQMSDEKQAQRVLSDEVEDTKARLNEARSRSDKRREGQNLKDLKVEIAQAEGRLELLKKEAKLSTITVNLSEKSKTPAPVKTGGFMDEMGETGRNALASLSNAARIPILALIWLAAYAPVWVPLAIAYRYAAKAHRRRSEIRAWQARRAEGNPAV